MRRLTLEAIDFTDEEGTLARLRDVRQTIHDPESDHDWVIEAVVDLDASDEAGEPVVETTAFRRL